MNESIELKKQADFEERQLSMFNWSKDAEERMKEHIKELREQADKLKIK